MTVLADKAQALRDLHVPGNPLVVINVWDAISARTVAAVDGVRALATPSAGIAAALGYEDHEGTPASEMLAAVGRIAAAVDLPVTADLEAGYGDPGAITERAMTAGVVGCNLEDVSYVGETPSLLTLESAAAAVTAVRAAGDEAGVPFVINARTDIYIFGTGEPAERVALAAERGNAYLAAGADCIFVPFAPDAELAALVEAIDGPVSVLARHDGPTLAQFAELGIARISCGPLAQRAAMAALRDAAQRAYGEGTFEGLGAR
jgi:2-methylisocitrate lyase-like PEP mutase family enzyme